MLELTTLKSACDKTKTLDKMQKNGLCLDYLGWALPFYFVQIVV